MPKLTDLSETTSIDVDDLVYIVIDPTTTPASKKSTLATLKTAVSPINDSAGNGDTTETWSADKLTKHTINTPTISLVTDTDNHKIVTAHCSSTPDSYTKLLLHMNADSPFVDVMGHTVTTGGNAYCSTSTKKLGAGSMSSDGDGDYLRLNVSSDFYFGSSNFVMEMFVRPTNVGDTDEPYIAAGGDNGAWYLTFCSSGGGQDRLLVRWTWRWSLFRRQFSFNCRSMGICGCSTKWRCMVIICRP